MPTIHTSIDIAAPPEKVWAALTDYERYPEWNPFMRRIEGDRRVGGKLTVSIKPPKEGSSGMTFSPTILTYTPNTHLSWNGRLLGIPWLFSGHHNFILHPVENNENGRTSTHFEHYEDFSGILALVLYWTGNDLFETTRRGFVSMNEGLRGWVEGDGSGNGGNGGGSGGESQRDGVRQRVGSGGGEL